MSQCVAIERPVFLPAMRIVSAISQSDPLEVTTTFAHLYLDGCIVRLDLPQSVGMQQANQLFGPLTVTSATTFTLPFDSTLFGPFSIPVSPLPQVNTCALSVPIGETNLNLDSAVQNVLPYSAT